MLALCTFTCHACEQCRFLIELLLFVIQLLKEYARFLNETGLWEIFLILSPFQSFLFYISLQFICSFSLFNKAESVKFILLCFGRSAYFESAVNA